MVKASFKELLLIQSYAGATDAYFFSLLLLLLNQIQDNDSTSSKSKTNVGGKFL